MAEPAEGGDPIEMKGRYMDIARQEHRWDVALRGRPCIHATSGARGLSRESRVPVEDDLSGLTGFHQLEGLLVIVVREEIPDLLEVNPLLCLPHLPPSARTIRASTYSGDRKSAR
jgi:hypothetical protein